MTCTLSWQSNDRQYLVCDTLLLRETLQNALAGSLLHSDSVNARWIVFVPVPKPLLAADDQGTLR